MAGAVKDYFTKLAKGKSRLHRTPKESRRAVKEDELVRRHASKRFPEAKVRKQVKKTYKALDKNKRG